MPIREIADLGLARADIIQRHIEAIALPVAPDILPEVRQLQRRAERIGRFIQATIGVPRDSQHEASHRVRGSAAVIEHAVPGLVAVRRDILTKRAEQILEQADRKIAGANRGAHGEKHLIRRIALRNLDTRVQPIVPIVQQPPPLLRRPASFVCEIVGGAGKRVERRDVRPHRRRQQSGRHGKIFVVGARQPFAGRVGGAQLLSLQAGYFTGDCACGT